MSGSVPKRAPIMTPHGASARVRAALPVGGASQWYQLARMTNFLLGHGSKLVNLGPDMSADATTAITAGNSREYRFWIWPHEQNNHRQWLLSIAMNTAGQALGIVETNENSAGYEEIGAWSIPRGTNNRQTMPFRFPQIVTPSATPCEVAIRISNDAASTSSIFVGGIVCVETPRATLAADSITGVIVPDDGSVLTKRAIYQDAANEFSIDATYRGVVSALTQARRASIFNWATPNTVSSTATTFTGASNIFNIPVALLARKKFSAATTGTVAFKALTRGDGGAGEFRITMTSGDVQTVAIPSNASLQWIEGTLTVDCDDMSTLDSSGGYQGDTADIATIEFRRTTATTVYIGSINIGEAS